MLNNSTKLILFPFVFIVISCTSSNCKRKKVIPPYPQQKNIIELESPKKESKSDLANLPKTFVYKYNGSLQCGMGRAVPLKTMAKELNGISIFSQKSKPDGLMHIQACGTPTGLANVYEILERDIAKAQELGFKVWKYE